MKWLTLALCALLMSGCAQTLRGYLDAAEARQWQGCHCVRLIGSAGMGGAMSGEVASMLATGGATIEQCQEVQRCE